MPPQQPDGLLDVVDEGLCFRAHDERSKFLCGDDLATISGVCNRHAALAEWTRASKIKFRLEAIRESGVR
jgi:hypothetical protein